MVETVAIFPRAEMDGNVSSFVNLFSYKQGYKQVYIYIYFFPFIFISWRLNFFTVLLWFLPYIDMQVYINTWKEKIDSQGL